MPSTPGAEWVLVDLIASIQSSTLVSLICSRQRLAGKAVFWIFYIFCCRSIILGVPTPKFMPVWIQFLKDELWIDMFNFMADVTRRIHYGWWRFGSHHKGICCFFSYPPRPWMSRGEVMLNTSVLLTANSITVSLVSSSILVSPIINASSLCSVAILFSEVLTFFWQ